MQHEQQNAIFVPESIGLRDVQEYHLTPEIQRIVKEAICKETGIRPEQQNAVFLSESTGMRDVKKIVLPSGIEQLALSPAHRNADLGIKYPEIFDQSTVYVNRIGDWKDDFRKPENHTSVKRFIDDTGIFLRTLYSELDRPRTVDASLLDQFPDFRDGIERDLPSFLTPTVSAPFDTDMSPIELKCYVDIFSNIVEGVYKFGPGDFDSFALHTLFFGSMMIQPAFFWDKHQSMEMLEMTADCSSGFRMFIKKSDQSEIYKLTPKNDLAITDKLSSLPTLICEVDSHVARKNQSMIILQGMAACRQWQYVLPAALRRKNRLLGLFVHNSFDAELHLFHADDNHNVENFQQGFSLGQRNEALRLARILFNYRDKFLDIAGLSEPGKVQQVERLVSDSMALPSLMMTTTIKTVSSGSSRQSSKQQTRASISETRTIPLLVAEKVQSLLCPDGAYLQATEHEYVAVVRMTGIPPKTLGFIKLTNRHELRAFDTIRNSGSEFLLSRVVLPTKVIEIDEYSVAFLPYGGEPLHHSWGLQDGPVGHETEIAWDLLTIISSLHELHIAHLDIKPSNILWDLSTLSIRVIDFDSSQKLDPNGSRKVRGIVGTPGYATPEVESKEGLEYDPFLTDAFKARFVFEISKSLSKADVNERWSINKAIEVWVDLLKDRGRPEHRR
ncbi:hypothetical protein ACEPAI_55 [Sanghuangporus weigelae]